MKWISTFGASQKGVVSLTQANGKFDLLSTVGQGEENRMCPAKGGVEAEKVNNVNHVDQQ